MKRRVHCRFEEDLLDRVDRAAALLGLNRTEFIKLSCKSYLRTVRTNRESLKADA
jgi:uncharacterized protein (DUF1778 family)